MEEGLSWPREPPQSLHKSSLSCLLLGGRDERGKEMGRETDDATKSAVAQWFQSIGANQQVPPPHAQHHNIPHHPFQLHEGLVLRPLHVEFVQPGHVTCTFRIPACLTTNASHIIRTGVLASLVDNVGAAAFVTMDGKVRVSVDINVSYITPAKFGDEIEIDAKVLKYGSSVGVVSVDIRNKASGELVAQGRHTMYYRSSKL